MLDKLNSEIIKTENDIFSMLDSLFNRNESEWWNNFYGNREKPIPFFQNIPDENLVSYVDSQLIKQGKVLDIGCGIGRNSLYLASKGFEVCGIDISKTSIEWGKQIAKEKSIKVEFLCQSIFDNTQESESFDFVYDSGCFHHIKPHRRLQYLNNILRLLKPNGYFGMTCFNLKGGANISDYDVYRDYSMHGGLGFTEQKLIAILEQYFEIVEFRGMKEISDTTMLGLPFLWTVLMKKRKA